MSYLDDVELKLRQMARELKIYVSSREFADADAKDKFEHNYPLWEDDVVKFVREKLLESFKNGLEAGKERPNGLRGATQKVASAARQ